MRSVCLVDQIQNFSDKYSRTCLSSQPENGGMTAKNRLTVENRFHRIRYNKKQENTI